MASNRNSCRVIREGCTTVLREVNAELARSADEERVVFVVNGRARGRGGGANLPERGKRGLDSLNEGHPLARRRDDRRLQAGRRLLDAAGDVGKERVDAFDLQ